MLGETPGYSGPLLELWAYLLLLISSLNLALRTLLASIQNQLVNIVTNTITRIISIASTATSKCLLVVNEGWAQCLHLVDWLRRRCSVIKGWVGGLLKGAERGVETRLRSALETTLVILRQGSFLMELIQGSSLELCIFTFHCYMLPVNHSLFSSLCLHKFRE